MAAISSHGRGITPHHPPFTTGMTHACSTATAEQRAKHSRQTCRKGEQMNDMATILILDDNRTSLALMDMLTRKLPGFDTRLFTSAPELTHALGSLDFDAAVLDHQPPHSDAIELTRRIRATPRLADRPVILVTGGLDAAQRQAALAAGVSGFLQKPIKPVEFKARLTRLIGTPQDLSPPASASSAPPESAEELIGAFTRAAGYKDRELPLHPARMARYCVILAQQLGLPEKDCADLRLAAPLHDIGKVGLPDEVLQNRGILSQDQRRVMAEHTRIGYAILSTGRSSVMKLAADIALTHHERWDGKGYPHGLKGDRIPLAGRIAAVADVFDALTSFRPYKSAWTASNAFSYLLENAGTQFDPACVRAFHAAREEITTVMTLMPDIMHEADADAA